MSLILGRVALDGKSICPHDFRSASVSMRPEGTTCSKAFLEGNVGLAQHDMGLSDTTPQPTIQNELFIVADVRLDSPRELAGQLGVPESRYSSPELILIAYRQWGIDCLAHLYGDFAFAIYDSSRREVVLARDHIGSRPLYWTKFRSEVVFASFLQGIRGFKDLRWELSQKRIAQYLFDPDAAGLETFFNGIETVGPGHWVRVSTAGIKRQRWWNPISIPTQHVSDAGAAYQELRHLTEKAIYNRIPENTKVGTHFSGGIDSTLVTRIAAQMVGARGSNLSAAYAWSPPLGDHYPDMGKGDERHVVSEQCRILGIPARYGESSPKTFEQIIAKPMELQGTSSLVDELSTIDQAKSDGVAVVLSGWGGDEALSNHSFGHLAWLLRRGNLRSVFQVARRRGGGLRSITGMGRLIWQSAIVPLLPNPIYDRCNPFVNLYEGGAFPSIELNHLHERLHKPNRNRLVPNAQSFMCKSLLNGHIAERMATWATWSAPAGFEYRYPLTDRRLIELILSLPPELKFGDGSGHRSWVRNAFADLLPKGVKKYDHANEKFREDNRLQWWNMLRRDVDKGRFEASCPWLDMKSLIKAIQTEPEQNHLRKMRTFARIFTAMRVLEMHSRHS